MIKREVFTALEEHLEEKEMTILVGPRQVGKTFIMKLLQKKLDQEKNKTIFLNLDIEEDRQRFISQATLFSYLQLQLGKEKAYVFIDEIQRKENAGLFLKGMYDMNLPYKFIISGSGSLELKANIQESMAGRKRIFIIEPINFEEFVNFRTNYRYEDKLQEFFSIEENQTQRFLEEYMTYGGYPKVILSDIIDKKRTAMEEIYRSYVEKDINELLAVEKPEAFSNLLKILASQIGQLVNITEFSSTIGIADKTIHRYLWYLEQTFIIKKVTPYFRNARKEITKAPTFYFYDTGLRNFLLGLFGLATMPSVLSGHLFENFVFNVLREKFPFAPTQIHFWRTRDNAEVDFVLQTGLEVVPIEVKYTRMKKVELTRSYRSFLSKYQPKKGFIIHLGKQQETQVNNTKVYVLPYYALYKDLTQTSPEILQKA